ncbi:MAG: hypothetical protein FJ387_00730 [Verrucomicrobia bacterium]|nr:hypothetical protein [Verrucomicrobiota bacterium]
MEWNIQSRAHACQECGRGFRDRERLHTLLFDERQGYRRFDVCADCWEAQYGQGANHRKGFVSHWQGVHEVPTPKPEPIQKETAETLLRKLAERNQPEHRAACFILAVMLERKRLLRVKAENLTAGQRFFLYEHARNGDLFTILDPNLQLDQLEVVQREVAQLLEQGLPAPPSSDPSPPVPDPPHAAAPTLTAPVPAEASGGSDEPANAPATEPPPPDATAATSAVARDGQTPDAPT